MGRRTCSIVSRVTNGDTVVSFGFIIADGLEVDGDAVGGTDLVFTAGNVCRSSRHRHNQP